MKNFLKLHFPSNRDKFHVYLKQFIPIVMGSLLFALNGVVDNFMVGRIDQGVTALSAANQWSVIMIGWFIATASAGGVIISQCYHDNNIDYVRKISRYRFFLCFIFVIPFTIMTWTYPEILISTFYKSGINNHNDMMVYKYGREYLEIISIQWILMAFSFNMGTQFAELGYGKYRMYFGVGTLLVNIFLNAMLIFVADMKVRGAAIATVGGRVLFIILSVYVIRKNKIPMSFNIFKVFQIDRQLHKIYWKRWIYIISTFTVHFFISFRAFFYARGYVSGSLGIGVSATSVLGLTGSLLNVFAITFGALASMSAIFVSSELGKGNYKQAKINADELKGFNTFMSIILAIAMIIFAAFVPYMSFLSSNQYHQGKLTFSATSQLKHVRNSLFVLGSMYPIWIWFLTSYRNGNAGGNGNKFAIFNWLTSGPIQLGWLVIIILIIVPKWAAIQNNFAATYALFFIFDFVKLIGFEYFYYTNNKWLYSIVKNEVYVK